MTDEAAPTNGAGAASGGAADMAGGGAATAPKPAPVAPTTKRPGKDVALRPSTSAQAMALVPQTMDDAYRMAQAFHRGGLAPSSLKTPEAVFTAMAAGAEIGLLPFQSLRSFAVINGVPTLWGDAIPALLWAHGFDIEEWFTGESETEDFPDKMTAHCRVIRPGGKQVTRKFSVADAKRAKLWMKKGREGADTPWVTYPQRQLQMRARSWAARDAASDVLRGIKIREEADDYVEAEIIHGAGPGLDTAYREEPVIDAEVTEGAPQGASETAEVEEVASLSEQADALEKVDPETGEVTDDVVIETLDKMGAANVGESAQPAAAPQASPASATTASPASPTPQAASGQPATSSPTSAGDNGSGVADGSAEGETSKSPPTSDASPGPEPDAFSEFATQVAALTSWDSIRMALTAFMQSAVGKAGTKEQHEGVRMAAYDAAVALADAPKPDRDPWFFNLWVQTAPPPAAAQVKSVFSDLIFGSGYAKMTEGQKGVVQTLAQRAISGA